MQVCSVRVFSVVKVSSAKKMDCSAQGFLVKAGSLVPASWAKEAQVEVPLIREMNPADLGSLAQAS